MTKGPKGGYGIIKGFHGQFGFTGITKYYGRTVKGPGLAISLIMLMNTEIQELIPFFSLQERDIQ